ncbi:glycosyltransferase family 2 protein [Modestobacter sp. VKM Ac-2985]|uniref:glycosyltransferase family 2 protein n=1 Tax=Modestobacter sp. VKM Ac-2985 TaxID=3004139 RepID=UPI0022AB7DCE|nr:glycosyltransferase [Modestobacter sp. VKM Ac-2985]MCZ2837701.1 glycosyltransferase [Modestobacter sp. VKM Ac-2985]
MSEPDVSVVIPAYRRPDRLRSCLTALAGQDHPRDSFEVVVVDDGSPEPLAALLPEFTDRLRLTVHRQANAGPAVARNVGAEQAAGQLLAFTDDDCEPEPGWVGALAATHRATPEAMIGGSIVNALPDQRCAEASQLLVGFLYEWFSDGAASRFFASNNLAVPRADFLALGGFDTTFPRPGGEDRELCERWRRTGRDMVEAPDAVVRHSHTMALRGFCRQHWNYGRGAYDVHRRRVAAGEGKVRIEPARFYWELLTYPFGRAPLARAVPLAGLMAVSQVANAAGFAFELRQQRGRRGGVEAAA